MSGSSCGNETAIVSEERHLFFATKTVKVCEVVEGHLGSINVVL